MCDVSLDEDDPNKDGVFGSSGNKNTRNKRSTNTIHETKIMYETKRNRDETDSTKRH